MEDPSDSHVPPLAGDMTFSFGVSGLICFLLELKKKHKVRYISFICGHFHVNTAEKKTKATYISISLRLRLLFGVGLSSLGLLGPPDDVDEFPNL